MSFAAIMFVLAPLIFTFLPFALAAVWAPTGTTTNAQSAPRKTSPPYTGDLSIFEDKDRDKKLQVQRVMDIMGIKEGTHVADIGPARDGLPFARQSVRNTGIVYAVDINPESIAFINRRIQRDGIRNVRAILSGRMIPSSRRTALIPYCC
jgi:hypothetical protein